MIEKTEKLYEGKAKIIYKTTEADTVIQYFKDDISAFDAAKTDTLKNKGILNNNISTIIFEYLEKHGVQTHYKARINDREMAVKALTIFPIEVVLRNRVAGSLAKRLGLKEGTSLKQPILEFFYKNDALHDPMISETCPLAMGWMTQEEVDSVKKAAWKIHDLMTKFFDDRGIILIDYKLEFGKDANGKIFLADEISPDSCRLWEKGTEKKLDKDRFRRDLGNVTDAYKQVEEMIRK